MRRIRQDPIEKMARLLIKRLGKKSGDMNDESGAMLKRIIMQELRKKAEAEARETPT